MRLVWSCSPMPWRIQHASYNVIKTNKAKPKNINLMCHTIIECYTLVEALDDVKPDALVSIACSVESAFDDCFRLQAMSHTKTWQLAAKALHFKSQAHILSKADLATGSKNHLDIRKELRFYSVLYTKLVQANLYSPAIPKPAAHLLTQQDVETTCNYTTGKS